MGRLMVAPARITHEGREGHLEHAIRRRPLSRQFHGGGTSADAQPGSRAMPDAFANVSALPDNMIDVVVSILETRAAVPSQQQMLSDYLSRIDFPEHSQVLEVGCGTGPVCRVLAQWPNVSHVVGIDPSPALLAKARELAQG